jgi:hypothetical protein
LKFARLVKSTDCGTAAITWSIDERGCLDEKRILRRLRAMNQKVICRSWVCNREHNGQRQSGAPQRSSLRHVPVTKQSDKLAAALIRYRVACSACHSHVVSLAGGKEIGEQHASASFKEAAC